MHTHKTSGSEEGKLASVEHFLGATAHEAERTLLEYRKTAFQRFPILFAVLGLFGSVTTVFGVEQALLRIPFFAQHPFLTLMIGLLILVCTGALYKRLS